MGKILVSLFLLILTSCTGRQDAANTSSTINDLNPAFRLELPPDILKENDNSPTAAPTDETDSKLIVNQILPSYSGIVYNSDGRLRWLEIDAPIEDVWNQSIAFWQDLEIPLRVTEGRLGIMETEWLETHSGGRSTVKNRVLDFFNLKDPARRQDRYRIRLERRQDRTLLFLTHRQVSKENIGSKKTRDIPKFVWIEQPVNHQLEAEMLSRIMAYFGSEQIIGKELLESETLRMQDYAQYIKGQDVHALQLNSDLENAWKRLGLALDKTDFFIEEVDHERWRYSVAIDTNKLLSPDEGFDFRPQKRSASKVRKFYLHLEGMDSHTKLNIILAPTESVTSVEVKAVADHLVTILNQ